MIEVLVGNLSSGKSTWCKQRAKNGWIIINDDNVVNLVHSSDYTLYKESLKPLYKSIEDHILHTAVAMNKNVVIDRGLDICATSRQRWIILAKSLDVPIRAVEFEVFTPEIHAKRRTEADSRGHNLDYWLMVAKKHFSVYSSPTLEEGFVDIEFKKWIN